MDGIEKKRCSKARKKPESKSQIFSLPFLSGKEKNLKAEQGSKNAHSEADEKNEYICPEQRAESIEGKKQKR
jgi:hypothetical protein